MLNDNPYSSPLGFTTRRRRRWLLILRPMTLRQALIAFVLAALIAATLAYRPISALLTWMVIGSLTWKLADVFNRGRFFGQPLPKLTWVELLVCLMIVGVFTAILLPAKQTNCRRALPKALAPVEVPDTPAPTDQPLLDE